MPRRDPGTGERTKWEGAVFFGGRKLVEKRSLKQAQTAGGKKQVREGVGT